MAIAGIMDGYNESRNHWTNRRAEAARAFQEFRSMHPNATYQDYRGFVDQVTGGNSFLRGQIPSDQILRKLAEQNQQQAQQKAMIQQMEMLRQEATISGTIGALATNLASQFDNDADVEDALVAQLGGTDLARERVRKMYSGGFGPIRQRAQYSAIKDNLPLALQIMEANPDADLSTMFPDMPKPFVSGLVDTAKRKREEDLKAKMETRRGRILEAEMRRIDMTGNYLLPNDLEENEAAELRSVLDSYKSKLETETAAANQKTRVADLQKIKTDLLNDPAFQRGMLDPAFDIGSEFKIRASQYGVQDLTADELLKFTQDLKGDSIALRENRVKLLHKEALTRGSENSGAFQSQAVESMVNMFGEKDEGRAAAGAYAGAAAEAVKALAQNYDLTDNATRSVISRLLKEEYLEKKGVDPADYSGVQQAIESAPEFRAVASSISATKAAREKQIEAATGMPDSLTSFNSWLTDFQMDSKKRVDTVNEQMVAPLLQATDLKDAGNIRGAIAELDKLGEAIIVGVERAEASSNIWLMGGSFDKAAALASAHQAILDIRAMKDRLAAHEESLKQKVYGEQKAPAEAARAAPPRASVPPAAPAGPSPYMQNRPAPAPAPWERPPLSGPAGEGRAGRYNR